jgi:Cdc6-like AAA superfamily ATPase
LNEVVDGVRLICREIIARRTRPETMSATRGMPTRAEAGPRPRYRLVEVFKESAFHRRLVEPPDFYQLKLALEQPGRGVVIEGPSGVGKTTALQTAVRQVFGDSAAFQVPSARSAAHNIAIERPSEIVRTAAGSLNVGQVLCCAPGTACAPRVAGLASRPSATVTDGGSGLRGIFLSVRPASI